MPKLKAGITGKARTDIKKGEVDSFKELPINPARPGPTISTPGPGTGCGSAPLGPKMGPKHKGGEYS
jgi:hypothetical protein